ncbi:hypothetical protein ELH75_36295, partial [Rhizobium leguminosarum]|uniref:thiamine pyrophosphate-dependent enzyme n=1 Tax=Rhizobium leguminosarum TaxID=384 RepID=UPI0010EBE1E0
ETGTTIVFASSFIRTETTETGTEIEQDIPFLKTYTVFNADQILGFQRDAETVKFGSFTTACSFADVDHRRIAEACGCPAVRISDPANLSQYLERGLSGDGPLLIEVITEAAAHPPLSLFTGMDQAA